MEVEASGNPLQLGPEAMRALGYRTVDMLVERLSDPTIPPLRRATPTEMRARLCGPAPAGPRDFGEILDSLQRDVLPFCSRGDHPGFLAFIPFAGTWPGALGDLVASACNIYAGSWMESAGPSQLELEVLDFRPDQLRVLLTDADFRIDPPTFADAVAADSRAGRRPLFLCASAGATNTGAVDPLPELAAVCRRRDIWFHVDAAYGGFAALTDRGRAALRGIELADSVTLDPHKWLYQPYECGALLVREDHRLRAAFEMTPHYLQDAGAVLEEVNFSDRNVQLTRSSRAIKVWMSLQYFGVDAFRAAIDRTLDLAGRLGERTERSDALERTEPACTASADGYERDRQMGMSPIRRRMADTGPLGAPVETVARMPLFATLDDRGHERVAALARITTCAAGETIVTQWDRSLDFYLVMEGRLETAVGDVPVGQLGPGDFFGEVAALDWGAGFGYPRTATVRAITAATLLTFPVGSMNELLRVHPSVAGRVRRAAAERLNAKRP